VVLFLLTSSQSRVGSFRFPESLIDRLDDEGIGLSGMRGSPAAYERARLSYTDDVFYEDVHLPSWNPGEGKEEEDKRGEAWDDDDSGSLTSVD
jgi:hypothetical protein